MKKILLVSGCSNTDKNFYSEIHPEMDCSWPKWPELLAEKLNMDCVNLGLSGAGNEYIYSSLLDYITENDTSNIGLVIPAWTQCNRKDFSNGWNMRWTNTRINPHGDVFSWIRRSLNYFLSFQILCEKYNLPYMQLHMLHLFKDWLSGLKPREKDIAEKIYPKEFRHKYPGDRIKDTKRIMSLIDTYENKINTSKFLGWPLSEEYGGFCLQKKLIKRGCIIADTMISDIDNHPNAKGQEVMAEFIYGRL
jgi:hypothetical protein